MIVPNKAIPYSASILSKLPAILDQVNVSITPGELYHELHSNFDDLNQFLLALDTLYVLEKIAIENGELRRC